MFTMKRTNGRICVGCPDGTVFHFLSIIAALEFIQLQRKFGGFGYER